VRRAAARGSRSREAGALDRRFDSNRVLTQAPIGAGQRVAGAAGGDGSAVHRQEPQSARRFWSVT
jgi:hypothetical protein